MPKFITIGYGDQAGYELTDDGVLHAAHRRDAELRQMGALIGIARAPTQVRNPGNNGVMTSSGAYMTSDLPVAGFAIIEAENLEDAISLVSKTPCAVAHGVVEVWPLETITGRA